MTELTQSPASDQTETKVSAAPFTDPLKVPSFPELIYAHYAWWRELRSPGGVTPATQARYDELRAAFQREHGLIRRAYWCSKVESAVVLTEKQGQFRGPQCGFHRETHWATRDQPDIAREMYKCDELAVKATTVLTGVRQRICMNLIMASAEQLLSLVDRRAAHADPEATARMLEDERQAIKETKDYYNTAANGQAQMIYFAGMAVVVVVLALVATVWLSLSWATPVAALIAGAIGAVVSVVQRINSGKFELDYDVGRPYALFLGGLRPLIGGSFAMIISFAFTGGLLHLPVSDSPPKPDHHLALLVVSFLAGFSERWAQDTLVAAVPGMGGGNKADTAQQQAAPGDESGQPSVDAAVNAPSPVDPALDGAVDAPVPPPAQVVGE